MKNLDNCRMYPLNSVMPYYRPMPQLVEGMLTTVKDTIITCTLCRGERMVAIKSQAANKATFTYCPNCKGSGTMSNNQEKYMERR
mgnify:FL=1